MCKKETFKYFEFEIILCYNKINFIRKGSIMKKFFRIGLCLAISLFFLLGCSKGSSTSSAQTSTEETTEAKTTVQETTEIKAETKTVIFFNDTRPGLTSTLTYTVEGDKVLKQTGHNVYDPEPLNKTPEELKALIEETYKGYQELRKPLTFKMEKLFKMQNLISQLLVLTSLEKLFQKNTLEPGRL